MRNFSLTLTIFQNSAQSLKVGLNREERQEPDGQRGDHSPGRGLVCSGFEKQQEFIANCTLLQRPVTTTFFLRFFFIVMNNSFTSMPFFVLIKSDSTQEHNHPSRTAQSNRPPSTSIWENRSCASLKLVPVPSAFIAWGNVQTPAA